MKQTSIIAALLTFFSLLLVLGAAVFFLYQGRQELQQHITALQDDLEGQQQSLSEFQTTAAARDMALSTAQALLATREAELVTRDEAMEQLQATREAELATRAHEEAGEAPLVRIVQPADGEEFTADVTLEVIVVAGHRDGMRSLRLEVGARDVTFQNNGDDFRIFSHRVLTLPEGQLPITATVTSATGVTASHVVNVVVNGPDSAGAAPSDAPILRLDQLFVAILPE
ncbi:MAG TPA: OmpH family outer membrane protein [Candidatus Sulfomarinibacteraceae bacterium]|nr:OmpH family outer membrane protein [Candidatus Sulfomarinibacteraceae bacterium]